MFPAFCTRYIGAASNSAGLVLLFVVLLCCVSVGFSVGFVAALRKSLCCRIDPALTSFGFSVGFVATL